VNLFFLILLQVVSREGTLLPILTRITTCHHGIKKVEMSTALKFLMINSGVCTAGTKISVTVTDTREQSAVKSSLWDAHKRTVNLKRC